MQASVTVIHLVKKTTRTGARTTTQQLVHSISNSSSGEPRASATVDLFINVRFLPSQRSCVRGARTVMGW